MPVAKQVDRPSAKGDTLRDLPVGGDRRSIARSRQALTRVLADPDRVAELAGLTRDRDWLVVMRAMDLLETLAHKRADWIAPHNKLFTGPLAQHASWEVRLQIARVLPWLPWTPRQRRRAIDVLLAYVGQPQKFVKAWALDSLAGSPSRTHR